MSSRPKVLTQQEHCSTSCEHHLESSNNTGATVGLHYNHTSSVCALRQQVEDMTHLSLSEIGAPKRSREQDQNHDQEIASLESKIKLLKEKKKKQKKQRAEFWKVPDGNLNQCSKQFLQQLIKKSHLIPSLDDIAHKIESMVRWKSLHVYNSHSYYHPRVGDTIEIVYGDEDDNHHTLSVYFSSSKRWINHLPKDALSWRVFQFDLDAQGGDAVPGMPTNMSGFTGELVLLQVKDRQSKFEKQMAEKAKKEGHCCAYEAHGNEEECSNCGGEDCDCGANLDRCKIHE